MNNELNSNTRTLIVAFVVGVFSLIPLRFYEVAQMPMVGGQASQVQVLGTVDKEVVNTQLLEAPYNEIDGMTVEEKIAEPVERQCLTVNEVTDLIKEVDRSSQDAADKELVIGEILRTEICK